MLWWITPKANMSTCGATHARRSRLSRALAPGERIQRAVDCSVAAGRLVRGLGAVGAGIPSQGRTPWQALKPKESPGLGGTEGDVLPGHSLFDQLRRLGVAHASQGGTDFPGSIYLTIE
jgi:hypothetical protein